MRAHHHLNVTSVAAHRRFWVETLGATTTRLGREPREAFSFPNLLIFATERPPSGGTKGTTVNHIGFAVADIRAMLARTRAAGYPIVTRAELPVQFEVHDDLAFIAPLDTSVAFVMGPDDMKVEFLEYAMKPGTPGIRLHHVHFFGPNQEEMRDWYVDVLGARPSTRGRFTSADFPDVNLTYSLSPTPVVGTEGRTLDRLGLEVEDLPSLCASIEAKGILLDRDDEGRGPFGVPTATLTDPWGTRVELSQGVGNRE